MSRFTSEKPRSVGSLIDELKKISRDNKVYVVSCYGIQFLIAQKDDQQPIVISLTEDEEHEASNV